ncbi:GntR family transcriptional regulator [Anaerobacillus sp. MEB173]|uniref:GntR family transcriptional regulator n=1 Tax=Anaerobacillus sp. MEB173 TaxID=3383345 RepID=UPI003F92AF29
MEIKADNRPLYLQVIDKIKNMIETGVYEAGEQLPSEFELAKQLGVTMTTLKEALRILEDEHVIINRHGVGIFVHNKPLFSAGIEELFSMTEMISKGGKKPGTILLSTAVEVASEEVKRKFEPDIVDELLIVERVRTADGVPVVYCLDKIPTQVMSKYHSYGTESMFDVLWIEAGKKIAYAVTFLEPLSYHDKISEILECDPETALLVLKQMHYDKEDRPVFYSINYFRADKVCFHVVRKSSE